MPEFLEKELTYTIIGCCFDVRNKYGMLHKEKVYDRALSEQLSIKGLRYVDQPRINVYSLDTGKILATYIPDKLVESKVILEIKAKRFVPREEYIRALEYLKTSEYELLYIINFGEEEFNPRRYIYTNDRKPSVLQGV